MNTKLIIISLVVLLSIGITIVLLKTNNKMNKVSSNNLSSNNRLSNNLSSNNPKDYLCARSHTTYMSTNIYPSILHVYPIYPLIEDKNCNANFTLIKFNGEIKKFTSVINDKGIINFAKFIPGGILSNDDEFFVRAPSKLMTISLNDLKSKGGIIYNPSDDKSTIIPLGSDKFKINDSIYRLKDNKILVEEAPCPECPPPYKTGELGYVNGLINWMKWTIDGTPISYVTIGPI